MKRFFRIGRSTEASSSRSDSRGDSLDSRSRSHSPDILRQLVGESDQKSSSSRTDEDNPFSEFKKVFRCQIKESSKKKGVFVVETNSENEGLYTNIIDVKKGKIIGLSNYKRNVESKWFLSEVIYHQIELAMQTYGGSISDFNITSWLGKNIYNESTINVAKWFWVVKVKKHFILIVTGSKKLKGKQKQPKQKFAY